MASVTELYPLDLRGRGESTGKEDGGGKGRREGGREYMTVVGHVQKNVTV